MSVWFYVFSTLPVFILSGLLAMAELSAAFLFVPLFYYMGMPLAEAEPAALLLNVVSLLSVAINYWCGKLITWREWNPANQPTQRTFINEKRCKTSMFSILRYQNSSMLLLESNLRRICTNGY